MANARAKPTLLRVGQKKLGRKGSQETYCMNPLRFNHPLCFCFEGSQTVHFPFLQGSQGLVSG